MKDVAGLGDSGTYDRTTHDILINVGERDPAMSALHEFGHHVDFAVLGHAGVPGHYSPELADWSKAIQLTAAVQTLRARSLVLEVVIRGNRFAVDKRFVRYTLWIEELFARSYAQYVVERGGDAVLHAELAMSPTLTPGRDVLYPLQWDNADFLPVADCFDALWERLGWHA
jgi:hypothetical protein